jgi:hypothetical protein
MSTCQRKIYRSENGDSWWLCREEGGRVYALHEANLSSGGTTTKIEISDFFGSGESGPEHQSLVRLIGELRIAL